MGSDIAAVQAVGDGFADATVSNLGPTPSRGSVAKPTLGS